LAYSNSNTSSGPIGNAGGAFTAIKSASNQNNNANNAINGNKNPSSDMLSNLNQPGLSMSKLNTMNMLANQKKPTPITTQNLPTIPTTNNVSNQQNKQLTDMDFNLLMAFQQEQMKNQVLMSYLYQNMGASGAGNDPMKQLDLMRLAGSLGLTSGMNNEVKSEFPKNDLSSLLMSGNNMMSNNNSNSQQFQNQIPKNMQNLNNMNNLSQLLMMNRGMNMPNHLGGQFGGNMQGQMQNQFDKNTRGFNGNNNAGFGAGLNANGMGNNNGASPNMLQTLMSLNNGQQNDILMNNKGLFNNLPKQ